MTTTDREEAQKREMWQRQQENVENIFKQAVKNKLNNLKNK